MTFFLTLFESTCSYCKGLPKLRKQAQLNKFIAKQQEENVWMREQITQLFSLYASEAGPNAPTAPTTVPPLHQDGFSYG